VSQKRSHRDVLGRPKTFPAYVTDSGIVTLLPASLRFSTALPQDEELPVVPASRLLSPLRPDEGMNPSNPEAVAILWRELDLMEPVDPWPRLLVRWSSRSGGADGCILVPPTRKERAPFAEQVAQMVDVCQRHAPDAVRRGWLDAPIATWELVDGPPTQASTIVGQGAYRSQSVAPAERIVAERAAPTSLETLWQWLASTPEQPFSEHPRAIVLTEAHAYVRRRDDTWHRIPLDTLRHCDEDADGDAVFLFGRNTPLILPFRAGCPVRRELGRILAGKR